MKFLQPLLLGIAFASSLFFMGTESGLFAVSLVALIGATVPSLCRTTHLPRSKIIICLLLFWLWLGISIFWSTVPYNSSLFFFIISALPLTFFTLTANNERHSRESGNPVFFLNARFHGNDEVGIWTVLILLALWALIQFIFLRHNPAYGYRIHQPMMDPNSLAAFFALGIFPALGWFAQAKEKKQTILAFCFVMLFAAALLVTQSRGAILGVAVAGIPFLLVAGRTFWKKAGVLCGAGTITALIVNALTDNRLIKSLGDIAHIGKTVSGGDRLELWQSTLKLIAAHPWGGTGLGTFYYYYPLVRTPNDHSDGFFAHNDPLQFWAEVGIVAPILFYALALAVVIRTAKTLCVASDHMRLRIIAPFCAIAAVFIHAHFTFHFYMLSILIAMGTMLAVWYRATQSVLGETRWAINRPVKITSAVALSVAILWLIKAGLGTIFATKANDMIAAKNIPAAQAMLDHAAFWSPESFFRVPQYKARLIAVQMNGADSDDKERLSNEALGYLDQAQKLNPVFTQIQYDRALILDYAGRTDEALQIYETILKNDTMYLEARINLAELYMRQGNIGEAKTVLDKGLPYPLPRRGITALKYLVMTAQIHRMTGDERGYEILMGEVQNRTQ